MELYIIGKCVWSFSSWIPLTRLSFFLYYKSLKSFSISLLCRFPRLSWLAIDPSLCCLWSFSSWLPLTRLSFKIILQVVWRCVGLTHTFPLRIHHLNWRYIFRFSLLFLFSHNNLVTFFFLHYCCGLFLMIFIMYLLWLHVHFTSQIMHYLSKQTHFSWLEIFY